MNTKRSKKYLDNTFDDWTSPATNREMGNMSSVKVNQKIVDECDLLITYYDKDYECRRIYYEDVRITVKDNQTKPQSKEKIALNYAFRKDKDFVNLFEDLKDSKYALILD